MTSDAERVVAAVLAEQPLAALAALLPELRDPALREVVLAAERRLGVVRLDPGGDPARLLRVVAGRPGLPAAELAEHAGLGGDAFRAAARVLLDAGLVTSTRFERTDCWSRTASGAAAVALLP